MWFVNASMDSGLQTCFVSVDILIKVDRIVYGMWKRLTCKPFLFYSMCNEFSQIFQLCQFVMVSLISLIMFSKISPSCLTMS